MNSTVPEKETWITVKRYTSLWYACTTVGLVMAAFLAPIHWVFVVATILVAWGGPLFIEFACEVAPRNTASQASSQNSSELKGEFNDAKQRKLFSDEHTFIIGTSTMWFATLLALLEPEDSLLFLILGFVFLLLIYGIRKVTHVLANSAR